MRKYMWFAALAATAVFVIAQGTGSQAIQGFIKTLQGAKALKATVLAGAVGGATSNVEITFAKPNLARIETADQLIVADGATVTVYDKASKTYYKDPQTDAALSEILKPDALALCAPFFDAKALEKASTKSLGTKTRKGVQYAAIEATFGAGLKKVVYYIDGEGLARQAEIAYSDVPEQTILIAKSLELTSDDNGAAFTFRAPEGAKELTPEERNAGKWFENLDEALAEAKKTGKLVMVDFSAVW